MTLLELLVVVVVVGVLVAITVPAISSARVESHRLKSLTNIRTLGAALHAYTQDHAELYPRIDEDVVYRTVDGARFSVGFWQASDAWVGIVSDYLPTSGYRDLVFCPFSLFRRIRYGYTSYLYSWVFLTRPEYWQESLPPSALINGSRLADVRFPSQKAILWDDDAGYLGKRRRHIGLDLSVPVPVNFVDGSARVLIPANATEGIKLYGGNRANRPFSRRILCTRDGVRGIDY